MTCKASSWITWRRRALRIESKDSPFFRVGNGRRQKLSGNTMDSQAVCDMVKRRLKRAGLPSRLSPHSFHVAAITGLLTQGVPMEDVQ